MPRPQGHDGRWHYYRRKEKQRERRERSSATSTTPSDHAVKGWQAFAAHSEEADAAARQRNPLPNRDTSTSNVPNYTIDETFKQCAVQDDGSRAFVRQAKYNDDTLLPPVETVSEETVHFPLAHESECDTRTSVLVHFGNGSPSNPPVVIPRAKTIDELYQSVAESVPCNADCIALIALVPETNELVYLDTEQTWTRFSARREALRLILVFLPNTADMSLPQECDMRTSILVHFANQPPPNPAVPILRAKPFDQLYPWLTKRVPYHVDRVRLIALVPETRDLVYLGNEQDWVQLTAREKVDRLILGFIPDIQDIPLPPSNRVHFGNESPSIPPIPPSIRVHFGNESPSIPPVVMPRAKQFHKLYLSVGQKVPCDANHVRLAAITPETTEMVYLDTEQDWVRLTARREVVRLILVLVPHTEDISQCDTRTSILVHFGNESPSNTPVVIPRATPFHKLYLSVGQRVSGCDADHVRLAAIAPETTEMVYLDTEQDWVRLAARREVVRLILMLIPDTDD
ncbi:hypothetical protein FN846DRAFT_895405 [Sphaerosporella brunnea]|uniref:Uncharacterized protein n=1 Tax=Sphaerosporella brunnea TaxID=1250544 RepID=A0A5J5EFR5_9PEZI|nr:hypothetical protein FN846DRAFT_895405 [Sphaerosporella brunnea]